MSGLIKDFVEITSNPHEVVSGYTGSSALVLVYTVSIKKDFLNVHNLSFQILGLLFKFVQYYFGY